MERMATKGERTRNTILEETIRLIATEGFDSITYDRIARSTGVSRQLVQKYFPDRGKWLILAFARATESLVESLASRLAQPANAQQRLEAYIDCHFDWAEAQPHEAATLLAFLCLAASHAEAKEENTRTNGAGWERIRGLIVEMELNGFSPEGARLSRARLDGVARGVQAMLIGALTLWQTDSAARLEEMKRLTQSWIAAALTRAWEDSGSPRALRGSAKPHRR